MSICRSQHGTQDVLDFIALGRQMMLPVGKHAGGGKDESNIHLRVLNTDTFVGTTAKYEIVLRVGIGRVVGIEPPFGDQAVMIGVHFGVVQRVVEGWDQHTAGRDCVIRSDGEWLRGLVRNLTTKSSGACHRKVVDEITMVTGGLTRKLSLTKAFR